MKSLLAKEILISNNFWVLNKTLVKVLGIETAFLLSSFAEAEKSLADKEGWFYQTSKTVGEITTLSRHKQDRCIKQLIDMGIIEQANRGMPMKRYFKFNNECLTSLLVDNLQPRLLKIDKLGCEKLTTSKELNKEHINKEQLVPNEHDSGVEEFFEECWKLYPKKRGKSAVTAKAKKETYKLGDRFEKSIQNYIAEIKKEKTEERFIKYGSTFWNGGYKDYLEEEKKDKEKFVPRFVEYKW